MRVSLCSMLLLLSTLGIAFGQDTNFPSGPQYLMNGSPLFTRSISTPSIALTDPPLQVGASNGTGVLIAGAGNQAALPPAADAMPRTDLFPIYYGRHAPSVIEISLASEGASNELPASILDTGVWEMTTVDALRARGYGVTVVEGAAYGKAHTRRAARVYTNADIDRLHSGS